MPGMEVPHGEGEDLKEVKEPHGYMGRTFLAEGTKALR